MKGEAKLFASLKETSEKRHEKALGKAWNQRSLAKGKSKSGAEGESLKLLKESGAIFLVHNLFVYLFYIFKSCKIFVTIFCQSVNEQVIYSTIFYNGICYSTFILKAIIQQHTY